MDLDRTIGAYLPEYRGEAATKVTVVRQLLNHTLEVEEYRRHYSLEG